MEDSLNILIKTLPVIDPTWLVAVLIQFELEIFPWFVLQIFRKSYNDFCVSEPQIWDQNWTLKYVLLRSLLSLLVMCGLYVEDSPRKPNNKAMIVLYQYENKWSTFQYG